MGKQMVTIPDNFFYLDSFTTPREVEVSKRSLDEHITEENRFKYFLELKDRRDSLNHRTYTLPDFPVERLIYLLVWRAEDGSSQYFKVGQSQHCWQRIGRNYLAGSGSNTGWLAPAMYEFLKVKGGEFEIYARGFDTLIQHEDRDLVLEYVPRLDKIEKHYQNTLQIKDGKLAVAEFFKQNNFEYIIK
tara:strand:- start:501 stop:1064 length:564 start_codon:yes stop_codon:yes gene_type:complete